VWPDIDVMQPRPFTPAPLALEKTGLTLTESVEGWALTMAGEDVTGEMLPTRRPVGAARFNPLLCRRFLRAILRLRASGRHKVAIFGTGGHSEELLQWGFPDDLHLAMAVGTNGSASEFHGLPVVRPGALKSGEVDAILLSSVTYEPEMLEIMSRLTPGVPAVPLYSDWPRDFWKRR
jgi:hypothetical protein